LIILIYLGLNLSIKDRQVLIINLDLDLRYLSYLLSYFFIVNLC